MGAVEDFLGLHWRSVGPHKDTAVHIQITEAGERAGLAAAGLPTDAAAYARSFSEAGLAYNHCERFLSGPTERIRLEWYQRTATPARVTSDNTREFTPTIVFINIPG